MIPIEAAGFKEAFHVSFNDGKIIDIQFLHNCNRPTLIVLYEDNKQSRHVKTVVIDLKERDAISGSFALNYVEFAANKLIPVASPVNGVLVVGAVTITYISISDVDFVKSSKSSSSGSSYMRTCEIQRCIMMSSTAVSSDGKRYLLGDSFGNLISLALVTNKNPSEVEFLAVDYLGVTSTAETISYLGTGVVYIGSTFGDSQLLKLHPNNDSSRSCIEVMDIYAHIGPILDMCLVDNEKNGGQKQLVTCSGAFKDGSLRIIKSGIGIIEQVA